MVTRRLLNNDANQRLRGGDFENAERGLIALIRSAPHDLNARLRAADGLLAAGKAAGAIATYVFIAKEAALAGHPLKSIVALKILSSIDPGAQQFLEALGQRYGAGSAMLGRAVRLAPPDPESEVPSAAFIPNGVTTDQVFELAAQASVSREALPGYPPTVAPIPLLSDLPGDAFARMIAAVQLRRPALGEVVIREGEPGEAFFMIARGAVRVSKRGGPGAAQDTVLAQLGEGSIFGEMALVSGAPRGATVTAVEDTDVLVFGRDALEAVARDLKVVEAALDRFTRERLLSNLLATHPLFRPFDRAQRQQLAGRFSAHEAAPGTVLIREGDAGRGIFLLLSGEVDVQKIDGNDRVLLAMLKAGDVFGEISLIEQSPTTATVTASRQTTVLFLARDVFDRLVQGVPALKEYFHQLAEERLMDTNMVMATSRESMVPDAPEDETVLF
ncbi:MAG: cyclic nucleotide-binding domain-containing protein [Deltaproteobacteria bacterium]